ncbi:unnamed protein product [Aspergillus oryzae]|nr:unnamed protein product [Aspergillus oryzae]
MAGGMASQGISAKRAELAGGRVGWRGLVSSKKTFGIALFASLGGLVYGCTAQGMLTSILELGAWLGTLANGYLADALGRRVTVVVAVVVFCVGVIVQACTTNPDFVYAGRFVTGLGVGNLSMIVPLYNAELIGYGTNFIGGTGEGQSIAAWEIPVCIQILPALVLAVGMMLFMHQSPRHLMNQGREEECLQTVARLRDASVDDMLVRIEFLEMKALRMFEEETARKKYPQYQDGSFKSRFMIGVHDYMSLITDKSLFKRTTVAVCYSRKLSLAIADNFFRCTRWTLLIVHSPQIFKDLELGGTTTSLLATGVAGIFEFVFTIPAVLWVDNIGRKKILIAGGIGMAVCHFIVAGIIGSYQHTFAEHKAPGWVAVLNNFAVGLSTSPFLSASNYGTFIFFGCITTIGVFWVWFLVPETKGRTLEEMDELFGSGGMAAEDEARKRRIEREIGLLALLGEEPEHPTDEKVMEKPTHVDNVSE